MSSRRGEREFGFEDYSRRYDYEHWRDETEKQELGYSYEKIADLTDLPIETVQAVFKRCSDPLRDDVLKALERVVLSDKEVTYKYVELLYET